MRPADRGRGRIFSSQFSVVSGGGEEREQKSGEKGTAIMRLSQTHKNKGASERQPPDKAGARGKQRHCFLCRRSVRDTPTRSG